ncbi:MAG: hypothetical protein QM820_16785 [Minicystis sp.]
MKRALLTALVAVALIGCNGRQECRAMLDAIEPPLAEIGRLQKSTPVGAVPDAATIRATSAAYGDLAERIKGASLMNRRHVNIAAQYSKSAAEIAAGLEMLADARESFDDKKLQAAIEKIENAEHNEQLSAGELADTCGTE